MVLPSLTCRLLHRFRLIYKPGCPWIVINPAPESTNGFLAGEVFFLRYRYCYLPYCFFFLLQFSITVTSHYVFCYSYLEKKHHSATDFEATCCENSSDALKTQMVILAGEALLWFDA